MGSLHNVAAEVAIRLFRRRLLLSSWKFKDKTQAGLPKMVCGRVGEIRSLPLKSIHFFLEPRLELLWNYSGCSYFYTALAKVAVIDLASVRGLIEV